MLLGLHPVVRIMQFEVFEDLAGALDENYPLPDGLTAYSLLDRGIIDLHRGQFLLALDRFYEHARMTSEWEPSLVYIYHYCLGSMVGFGGFVPNRALIEGNVFGFIDSEIEYLVDDLSGVFALHVNNEELEELNLTEEQQNKIVEIHQKLAIERNLSPRDQLTSVQYTLRSNEAAGLAVSPDQPAELYADGVMVQYFGRRYESALRAIDENRFRYTFNTPGSLAAIDLAVVQSKLPELLARVRPEALSEPIEDALVLGAFQMQDGPDVGQDFWLGLAAAKRGETEDAYEIWSRLIGFAGVRRRGDRNAPEVYPNILFIAWHLLGSTEFSEWITLELRERLRERVRERLVTLGNTGWYAVGVE